MSLLNKKVFSFILKLHQFTLCFMMIGRAGIDKLPNNTVGHIRNASARSWSAGSIVKVPHYKSTS